MAPAQHTGATTPTDQCDAGWRGPRKERISVSSFQWDIVNSEENDWKNREKIP